MGMHYNNDTSTDVTQQSNHTVQPQFIDAPPQQNTSSKTKNWGLVPQQVIYFTANYQHLAINRLKEV